MQEVTKKSFSSIIESLANPELKNLTTDVFKLEECPKWARSAFIDEMGHAVVANVPKQFIQCYRFGGDYFWAETQDAQDVPELLDGKSVKFLVLDSNYDTSDWKHAKIDNPYFEELPESTLIN